MPDVQHAAPVARAAIVPCAACGKLSRVDLARIDDRATCGHCKSPLVLDAPLVLTDATFDRVVTGASVPVVVDFYADWCGPCKMMAPVFAEFARRQRGSVLVAKVDTDRNPAVSSRFGIRSIPTLTVHRDGKEVARQVGAVPMAALEELIRRQ
jgi:thioredoxin 2